jgi:hypothetical protein
MYYNKEGYLIFPQSCLANLASSLQSKEFGEMKLWILFCICIRTKHWRLPIEKFIGRLHSTVTKETTIVLRKALKQAQDKESIGAYFRRVCSWLARATLKLTWISTWTSCQPHTQGWLWRAINIVWHVISATRRHTYLQEYPHRSTIHHKANKDYEGHELRVREENTKMS